MQSICRSRTRFFLPLIFPRSIVASRPRFEHLTLNHMTYRGVRNKRYVMMDEEGIARQDRDIEMWERKLAQAKERLKQEGGTDQFKVEGLEHADIDVTLKQDELWTIFSKERREEMEGVGLKSLNDLEEAFDSAVQEMSRSNVDILQLSLKQQYALAFYHSLDEE